MCRHLAYLGPAVPLARVLTEPEHSLYEQSWRPARQRYGTVNADGFGVGWYPEDTGEDKGPGRQDGAAGGGAAPDPRPGRYRRAVPIWADENFPEIARTVRSGAVLAAVRSATAGTTQDESAAAPFRDGRWLFSHNGAVPDWTGVPSGLPAAELLDLDSHSDSALLWAMISRRLRQGEGPDGALAAVVREVAEARPTARLNFLLTDGHTVAATAWGDTLWYRTGPGTVLVASEPDGTAGPVGPEEHAGDARPPRTASEPRPEAMAEPEHVPQAEPDGWHEVPDRSLLLATTAGVRIIPLRSPRPHGKESHTMTENRFTLDNRLPADYFTTTLHADVARGLGRSPRTLPPKWFYDKRGSDLFEQITRLPEYYPTRAEQEILTRRAPEIAALTRAATLVELGSGSSRKTRLLLDALTTGGTLRRYAPLDVSPAALEEAGNAICRDYPQLRVTATVADFETDLALSGEPGPRLLAFLGSTIGNFDADQRRAFYRTLAQALSGDDVLLLGADLVKDPAVLVRAYDDAAGVTAEFNKNVLHVLNRELGADFQPDAYDHVALWNTEFERIEMRLRARTPQTAKIPDLDLTVDFAAGEDLRTELSCKFRRESLTEELRQGGFTVRQWWTDQEDRFALLLAVPN